MQTSAGDIEEEEEEDDGGLVHGRRRRKVQFMPSVGESHAILHSQQKREVLTASPDTTHTIYYRGHWLRVSPLPVSPRPRFPSINPSLASVVDYSY